MPLSVFNPDSTPLVDAILREFDCELPASMSVYPDRGRERKLAKREKVIHTVRRFEDLMASDDAPRTEAELLAALTPVMTWVLSWLFRQLVIQVLKSCWSRWNG